MIVFLDFEASSLSKKSFPVEVAWVFEDGRATCHLIKPAPDWQDWSMEAQDIHGISRSQLETEGVPVEAVAGDMVEQLTGHALFASAPSWDGKWLSLLLRAAGRPRHTLRLKKSDEAFAAAIREKVGAGLRDEDVDTLVEKIIARTERFPPAHRALPDAYLELQRLQLARDEAETRRSSLS